MLDKKNNNNVNEWKWMNEYMNGEKTCWYNYSCSQTDVHKAGYKIEALFHFQVSLMEWSHLARTWGKNSLFSLILSLLTLTFPKFLPTMVAASLTDIFRTMWFKKKKFLGERSALSLSLPINVILFLLFPSYFSMQPHYICKRIKWEPL